MAPFSNVFASGPELQSQMAAINSATESHNQAMQQELADREFINKVEEDDFIRDNRDGYHAMLQQLDPTSETFQQDVISIDPRAQAIPGFKQALGIRMMQNQEFQRDADDAERQTQHEITALRRVVHEVGVGDHMIAFEKAVREGRLEDAQTIVAQTSDYEREQNARSDQAKILRAEQTKRETRALKVSDAAAKRKEDLYDSKVKRVRDLTDDLRALKKRRDAVDQFNSIPSNSDKQKVNLETQVKDLEAVLNESKTELTNFVVGDKGKSKNSKLSGMKSQLRNVK
jgi:hypothetical protein